MEASSAFTVDSQSTPLDRLTGPQAPVMQQRRPDEKIEMPVYSDLLKDMEQSASKQQQQQPAAYAPASVSPQEYTTPPSQQQQHFYDQEDEGEGRRVRFADNVEYYDDDPPSPPRRRAGYGSRRSVGHSLLENAAPLLHPYDTPPPAPAPTPTTPPATSPSLWTTLKSLPKDKDIGIGSIIVFAIFCYALPKLARRWPTRLIDPMSGEANMVGMALAALVATILLRLVWSSR